MGTPIRACRALGNTCVYVGRGAAQCASFPRLLTVRAPLWAVQMYQVRMDKATAQQEAARRRPLSAQPMCSRDFVVTTQDRQGLRTAQVTPELAVCAMGVGTPGFLSCACLQC